MAKKQTMNIFEAHIEKVVIVLGLAVLGWVVYSSFLMPSGVEVDNQRLPATVVIQKAVQKSSEVVDNMSRPVKQLPPLPKPIETQSILVADAVTGTLAMMPPYGEAGQVEEKRRYHVPDIPPLKGIKVDLTEAVASVPIEPDRTRPLKRGASNVEDRDVTFVTVSAKFPMAELISKFQEDFAEKARKPLEKPEPVVAMVELQRRYLKPDGTWSEYETVPRIDKIDPMKDVEIPPDKISTLSQKQFEVLLADRSDPSLELDLLQPWPYDLVDQEWISPAQAAKDKGKKGKNRRFARNQPRGRARSQAANKQSQQEMDMMAMQEEMMMGGQMMGPGGMMPYGPGPGGMIGPSPTNRFRPTRHQRNPDDFKAEELYVWANDATVKPGRIYSYRMRLGFFNPIAGHNWFTEEQAKLKNERILWSPPIEATQAIKIPRRTYFFPKMAAGTKKNDSLSLDVYHKHLGKWYYKMFRVSPGSEIGKKVKQKSVPPVGRRFARNTTVSTELIDVDYRTGVTLIDILPQSKHWVSAGSRTVELVCADMIYNDLDGQIKRLGTQKNTWPKELADKLTRIKKALKEQQKEAQPANMRNRRSAALR